MKNSKHIIPILIEVTILLILICSNKLSAQQDSQYTQYMYAANVINPAYVGSRDVLSVTSQYRAQWTGLDGAPRTFNVTSNGPLDNYYFGLGVTAISESIGVSTENSIVGDVSYKIDLDRYTYLAFGIKAGLKLINIDYTKLDIYNTTDPAFQINVDNRLSPVIGSGVYVYSDLWYAGLSVPNILTTNYYDNTSVSTAKERATFYFIGGYVFYINNNLKFKPTFLSKFTNGAPVAVDLSVNFLFNEKFTLGASYRFGTAVNALTGFQVNRNFLIGYSYDMDTTDLGNFNGGSHGFFLRYDFGNKRDLKLLTPRFF